MSKVIKLENEQIKNESNQKAEEVFVLCRTLDLEKWQEDRLEKVFKNVNRFKNYLTTITLKAYAEFETSAEYLNLLSDQEKEKEEYKEWIKRKETAKKNKEKFKEKAPEPKARKALQDFYKEKGFTKYGIYALCSQKVQFKSQEKPVPLIKIYGLKISVARGVAEQVWRAWEKVLYQDGEKVHYRALDDCKLIPNISNETGMMFENEEINFRLGKKMKLKIKESCKDDYYYQAIKESNKVVKCEIKREWKDGKRWYYALLTIRGEMPNLKHKGNDIAVGDTEIGLSLGLNKIVIASADGKYSEIIELPNVFEETEYEKECQREMDEIRRELNSDNYLPNGTIRPGANHWKYNQRYYTLKHNKASVERLRTKHRNIERNILAKELLEKSGKVTLLDNNVKEWAKNFGRSVGHYAPSAFIERYTMLCKRYGGYVEKINKSHHVIETCSHCGHINKSVLDNYKEEWECEKCHTKHNRKVNAAINMCRITSKNSQVDLKTA